MFMWPRPFLWLTAYKRCRPGVHYWLPALEESARKGWHVNNVDRYLLRKFVLFWLPQDDLAETVETFSDLNLGCRVPELFNCNG
jgi:hypothetical protein